RKRPVGRRIPRLARQPLAAGRPGASQPRREPQGCRAAVRLSGDLRLLARRAWRVASCPARRRLARIRRGRREQRTPEAPRTGEPGGRKLRLAEGDRRFRRNLPSAALDPSRGDEPVIGRRAGVVVRMPASWRGGRPTRPAVAATVGSNAPSRVGAERLLDFRVDVSLDGAPLTPEEIASLLAATDGLALLRGQWVEVDAA